MPIITKRKLIKIGDSTLVTIPFGHTILEKGNVVMTVANSVVVYAPEGCSREKLREDLRNLANEV